MIDEDVTLIPSAPVDDLDIEHDEDELEWERRAMDLATRRIQGARARLEQLGIVDDDGEIVSTSLPTDMDPAAGTTLETG